MLKYKLIKNSDEEIVYEYYPEASSEQGTVSFDRKTNTCNIVTLANNDPHKRYALKLFKRIREFAKNNDFKKDGMIAWY